jgi:hypothetical protein
MADFRTALRTWERCMAGGSGSCGEPPSAADFRLDAEAISSLSPSLQDRVNAVIAQADRRVSCYVDDSLAECITPQRGRGGEGRTTVTADQAGERGRPSDDGRRRPIRPGG